MHRFRDELFSGWRAMATLTRTAVGRLQVSRMAREEGQQTRVFTDEGEALAHRHNELRQRA